MLDERRKVWIKSLPENLEMILPVTPFITFKESMSTSTEELLGLGEIDTGSSIKLDLWSCERFFPHQSNNYDFDISSVKYNATYYVEVFSRWMKQEQILQFQYYSPTEKINDYYCKIIGFSHGEKYGNKDIYYTLDFREHKQLKIDSQYVKSVNSDEIAASYGSDTYYVGDGDTLITIAAKIYGDSTKWYYLMDINNLQNPLDIKAGQALKL